LSLNCATTCEPGQPREDHRWPRARRIGWIGLCGTRSTRRAGETARLIREHDLQVSSLCRGGFFPAPTQAEREQRLDDNRRAIDEAAILGADVLVLVCGPAPDRDLRAARQMVEDGIAAVLQYAAERGVRLAIEPLHPLFAGDRSVVNTLRQANDLVDRLASDWLGVAVDVYHVWWDPRSRRRSPVQRATSWAST
jgi:sugar phosphate isomerase/epimerase